MTNNKTRDFERLTKEEYIEEYNCTYKAYDEVLVDYARERIHKILDYNPNYSNNDISYIIQDSLDSKDIYALVLTDDGGDGMMINIFDNLKSYNAFDWDFSFDSNLFYYLECGYEIKYMDEVTHNAILSELQYYYPHSIQNVEGVKRYIEYCGERNINTNELAKIEQNEREFNRIMIKNNNEVMKVPEKEETTPIPKTNKVYEHKITKKELLEEFKALIKNNINCYSEGYFISKPKRGYEKEWNLEHARLKVIDEIIKDENKLVLEQKNKEDRCL